MKTEAIALYQQLYESIPQAELVSALELSDDPRCEALLAAITDPQYTNKRFAVICRAANIQPRAAMQAIQEMYRSESALRIARGLPEIADAVVKAAVGPKVPCGDCGTTGEVIFRESGKDTLIPCPNCGGNGSIQLPGSLDHQKLAMEAAGVLQKGGNVVVPVQVNVGAPDITNWTRDTDAVFEGRTVNITPKDTNQ